MKPRGSTPGLGHLDAAALGRGGMDKPSNPLSHASCPSTSPTAWFCAPGHAGQVPTVHQRSSKRAGQTPDGCPHSLALRHPGGLVLVYRTCTTRLRLPAVLSVSQEALRRRCHGGRLPPELENPGNSAGSRGHARQDPRARLQPCREQLTAPDSRRADRGHCTVFVREATPGHRLGHTHPSQPPIPRRKIGSRTPSV